MIVYIVWGMRSNAIGDLSKEIVDIYASRDHAEKRLRQAKDHSRMMQAGNQFLIEEFQVKEQSPF